MSAKSAIERLQLPKDPVHDTRHPSGARTQRGVLRKHGAPHTIELDVDFDVQQLLSSIRDDGHGFDAASVAAAASTGRLGVLGRRERAARAGGRLEIMPALGGGTLVSLALPAR